jgi:hypothetical protein
MEALLASNGFVFCIGFFGTIGIAGTIWLFIYMSGK